MAEIQRPTRSHTLTLADRHRLTATGVSRVDGFTEESIVAQTDQGTLHIRGEGLHMETLSAQSGDLLVVGKITAVAYGEPAGNRSFFRRLLG